MQPHDIDLDDQPNIDDVANIASLSPLKQQRLRKRNQKVQMKEEIKKYGKPISKATFDKAPVVKWHDVHSMATIIRDALQSFAVTGHNVEPHLTLLDKAVQDNFSQLLKTLYSDIASFSDRVNAITASMPAADERVVQSTYPAFLNTFEMLYALHTDILTVIPPIIGELTVITTHQNESIESTATVNETTGTLHE